MSTDAASESTFTIGAVARLTGITVNTLRVWERRYDGLAPNRTGTNRRRYSEHDVRRLMLIKRLLDQGHSVGTVAHLPEDALRERLNFQAAHTHPVEPTAGPMSVLVYGETLPFLIPGWAENLSDVALLETHTVYAEFERSALTHKPAVLVAEWLTLPPEGLVQLHALQRRVAARQAVAVYGFSTRAALAQAGQLGITTLRAPVTATSLAAACRAGDPTAGTAVPPALEAEIPRRRFDNETLGRLANIRSRLRCECPHHLADLVFRLSAFEAYSLDCENWNTADAALHAQLYRTTAQARSLIEAALAHLIQVEGIALGETPQTSVETVLPSK